MTIVSYWQVDNPHQYQLWLRVKSQIVNGSGNADVYNPKEND